MLPAAARRWGGLIAIMICLGAAPPPSAFGAQPRAFAIGTNSFLLDGQPFQIRCGEIHAPRVPREYWRDRLRTARAMATHWNILREGAIPTHEIVMALQG